METLPTSPSLLDRKSGRGSTLQSRDKLVEAIVNKFVIPVDRSFGQSSGRIPTNNELAPIVRDTIKSIDDAENVLNVLPDLNLAAEIQIASILSTKDLITTCLDYSVSTAEDIPLDLRAEMITVVKKYFNDDYKLTQDLYDVIYDVLYRTGSYAVSIIPESSVDMLINGASSTKGKVSTESLYESSKKLLAPKGILGSATSDTSDRNVRFGLESLNVKPSSIPSQDDLTITFKSDALAPLRISDNADIIKIPKIQATLASESINSAYNVSIEGFSSSDLRSGDKRFYKNPMYTAAQVNEIKTAEQTGKPSIGRPLVQHYPSESVIPIHIPGDFKMQIGYLIVLDNVGNPISKHDLINSNIAWSWMNGSADQKVKRDVAYGLGLTKDINTATSMTVSQLTNSYAEFVENKVINSIKNGIYGDSVAMSRPQDIYRIMMARSLAKKATQLLYVPVEQMIYFALDYNDFGIGRSLLDKNKMLSTVRSALQFATLNGSILNSTRNLEYNIQLDPGDREAEKTIEDIRYRVMQSYNSSIPFTGTPDDMWAYMSNAGLSFNVEGNEFYPSTKISVQDNSPDYKIPDQSTVEDLQKQHYRGLGLDPELIISPESIEFASQVTSKNLLAARRICKIQERLNPFITQFVKTYLLSDGILLKELSILIRTELGEESKQPGVVGKYINSFLRALNVTLPSPDTSMLGSQIEQYDIRSDALDKVLDNFINEDALGEIDADPMKAKSIIKSYLMRKWLKENDVEPDVLSIFEDSDARADLVQTIANDTVDSATLLSMLFNRVEKRVETVAKKQGRESSGGMDDYSNDTGESGDEDTSGGEDDYGSDDFGSDDFGEAGDSTDETDSGMDEGSDDDSADAEMPEDEGTDEEADPLI